MRHRARLTSVLASLCLLPAIVPSTASAQQRADVPMRDGVKLKTTFWLPGKGKFPAVLTRGYSPSGLGGYAPRFNAEHPSHIVLPILARKGAKAGKKAPDQILLADTGVVTLPDRRFKGGDHYWFEAFQTHVPIPRRDYTEFKDGRVYQRLDVLARPSLEPWWANQQLQQDGYNGDHWWPGRKWITVTEPGVYTTDHAWDSMRDARGLKERWDDPPPLRIALAVQKRVGPPNRKWTDRAIFPMTVRLTWVLVKKGAAFSGWEMVVGVERPRIRPLGLPHRTFEAPVTVTLASGTADAEIRYTTDGSDPDHASPLYSRPFVLERAAVVKARAFKEGLKDSDVSSAVYGKENP